MFADSIIMYEVLSELRDIAARDGVSCTCGARELPGEQQQVQHNARAPAQHASALAAGILAVSIAVKLYMAHYNRPVGRRIGSAAMAAAAAP